MQEQKDTTAAKKENVRLLYPLNVWGLSFGCAVGWGAFMMPGNLFLPHAGPVGSIIAIALGSIAMLIIGANFCKLAQKYRDNGGLMYGYNGISYYSSTMSKEAYDFFGRMGLPIYAKNVSTRYTSTPELDAFFSVRYLAGSMMI